MRRAHPFLLTIVLLLVAAGCTPPMRIGALSPRPLVDVATSGGHGVGFAIDPGIADEFHVRNERIRSAQVTGWHTTLRNAFENGFKDAAKATPWVTVSVVETRLEFVPAAYAATMYGAVPAAVRAQLSYVVRLVDHEGNVIRRATGTAISKMTGTTPSGDRLAQSAVESMFEAIVQEFFGAPAK